MIRVLTLYHVTYIVFLSNMKPPKNKRHDLLFIGKSEKPYKLAKISICPLNNIHVLIQDNFTN